ncbi:hypothetical protein QUA32_00660 [Microcoleus sp. Pol14D6]|uniref:hypothetical protein n=1 Tax=unclassified Microcoleus TaxID=2642155 RepID=UPI002FD4AF0D
MKSASCPNLASVTCGNLTHPEVAVKSTVSSGDLNSFTYVYKFILLLIIGTCNESEVEACKARDAGTDK